MTGQVLNMVFFFVFFHGLHFIFFGVGFFFFYLSQSAFFAKVMFIDEVVMENEHLFMSPKIKSMSADKAESYNEYLLGLSTLRNVLS